MLEVLNYAVKHTQWMVLSAAVLTAIMLYLEYI